MRTIFFCFRRYCIRKSSKECAKYSSVSEGQKVFLRKSSKECAKYSSVSEGQKVLHQKILKRMRKIFFCFRRSEGIASENPQKNAQNILLFQKVLHQNILKRMRKIFF
jgi:cold shock CspA family protein